MVLLIQILGIRKVRDLGFLTKERSMRNPARFVVPACIVALVAGSASAVVVPFTETFSGPGANWSVAPTFTSLTYQASGGPDGSGYGLGSFGFASNGIGSTPILFRAQTEFGSSGGALFGNWFDAGVTSFSFSVRHQAAAPATFFARFLGGTSFTGVIALQATPVPAGEWTTFTVPMTSASFIAEGAPTLYNSTFGNVTKVQIGLMMDSGLALQPGPFTFEVDNFTVVPAPSGAAAFGVLALVGLRRRR